jgi:REP element-mobilizing transposase RayT
MARPLRVEFGGALYHVMSRGNERRRIVKDDTDRARRLGWLGRTVETYGWHLHAFVLMDNHDHLYVETPEPNLSAGMQHLNGSYTSYFNRRHRRSGHLFQGRYRAQLIENEGHYWEVSRYIHLNPVRARLVARPQEWRWGSYPGYHRPARALPWVTYRRVLREFGRHDHRPARALPWVTYRRVLREFGRHEKEARREYRRFVAEGVASMPACPWRDAIEGLIVGGEEFVERIQEMIGKRRPDRALPALEALRPRPSLGRIVEVVAESFEADSSGWAAGRRHDDDARAVAAFLARRRFGYRARQVAEALGYASHGGVVAAVRRVELAAPALRRRVNRLEKRITND